jgi:hypothetical protein
MFPPTLKISRPLPCLVFRYVRIKHQHTMFDKPWAFAKSPQSRNHVGPGRIQEHEKSYVTRFPYPTTSNPLQTRLTHRRIPHRGRLKRQQTQKETEEISRWSTVVSPFFVCSLSTSPSIMVPRPHQAYQLAVITSHLGQILPLHLQLISLLEQKWQ